MSRSSSRRFDDFAALYRAGGDPERGTWRRGTTEAGDSVCCGVLLRSPAGEFRGLGDPIGQESLIKGVCLVDVKVAQGIEFAGAVADVDEMLPQKEDFAAGGTSGV